MIKILTSNFGNYEEKDDKIIIHPISNSNGLVNQLKSSLKETNKVVFVPSSLNQEKTEYYSNIFFESLKMSGINFNECIVIDYNNKEEAIKHITNADLVFLCGGSTATQNELFNKIGLKEVLSNYNGVVMGQSAGSLNMEEYVFNSPEEQDKSEPIFFNGLGLSSISIEPHFVYDDSNFDDDRKFQRKSILEESFNRTIYGQVDGSHIFIDANNNATIYGETYLIKNGIIECICKNGNSTKI